MSARELIVLGTASQVPTAHRNHNGFFLRWDAEGVLFDPGEGTQRQMILAGVSASAITRICITHFHGDHCLGLAGVIQRLSLDNVGHEVAVHYPASGQVYFDRLRRASIFAGLERLAPRPIQGPGPVFESDELVLDARALDHAVDCVGYRLTERDAWRFVPERLAELGLSGPVVGELQREGRVEHAGRVVTREDVSVLRPGQAFAFIMDTRLCAGALELARGADLVVCESTYLDADVELARQSGHMTAAQAAALARDAGARRLVLGHFSQRYPDDAAFVAEAGAIHGDVVAAREPTLDDAGAARRRHVVGVPARE